MEESIQESRGDVVTTAAKFPHDGVEENLEEENDDQSARSQIIKYYDVSYDIVLIFCTLGKFLIE